MIRSIEERVLVRIVEPPEKKKGSLLLLEEKKEFQIGKVVSVGGLALVEISVDDYVYTRKYAGLLLEYDGIEYVSLELKEILAVSEELL